MRKTNLSPLALTVRSLLVCTGTRLAVLGLGTGLMACQTRQTAGEASPQVESVKPVAVPRADTSFTVQLDIATDGKTSTLKNLTERVTVTDEGEATLNLHGAKISMFQAKSSKGGYTVTLKAKQASHEETRIEVRPGDQVGVVCEMKADPTVEVANYLKACNITLHGTTESTFAFAHRQAMQAEVAKHFEAAVDRVKQTGHAAGEAAAQSASAIQETGAAAAAALRSAAQSGSRTVADKVGQATEATGRGVEAAGARLKHKGQKVRENAE